MNQPALYQRANSVQRYDAQRILQEYASTIQWRPDGRDTLIDIGSGSGNVLMEIVYPLLPSDFEELVGSDVSEKMVDYASKTYIDKKRTKFEVLDIGCKILPKHLQGRFDHVTSLYCLHWVQNQLKALENIYELLRDDGGDCLLVFLATNATFDVLETLSKDQKWSKYMQDCKQFTPPLQHSVDPGAEYEQLLQQAGFSDYSLEVWEETYFYEGEATFRDNMKAICPYLDRIPAELHEGFFDDFVNTSTNMNLREKISNSDDYRFGTPYKLVITYARKSNEKRLCKRLEIGRDPH